MYGFDWRLAQVPSLICHYRAQGRFTPIAGNDEKGKIKAFAKIVTLAALLGLAIYGAVEVWTALEDMEISMHGWIALSAGVLVTFALGAGLMFMVFYSNRQGYDDPENQPD